MQLSRQTGWLFLLFLLVQRAASQPPGTASAPQGLRVVQSAATLLPAIRADSPSAMVPLSRFLQPLRAQLVYATAANFTHRVLYQHPAAYLRKEAALALQQVQDTLQLLGLDLKIWDAYRPYSVTQKMWRVVPDERYAANPANGSGHNRGVAVDVTLTDSTGQELLMPTGFDNFTDSAHHSFMHLPQPAIAHRTLLKKVMEQYGFVPLATEWWHYSLPTPRRYDLLNVDFEEMRKVVAARK